MRHVQRVVIVGNSGSGKSTFARQLATRLGVPHIELDAIYHQPGWAPLPASEFTRRVADATADGGWVVDGNYSAVRAMVWERATTVVWLDLPRHIIMRRIIWRTLRRVGGRIELWNGNRERWRDVFTVNPDKSVIAWAWQKHRTYHDRYTTLMNDPANARLVFIRVGRSADARRLLGDDPAPEPLGRGCRRRTHENSNFHE
jgi:adenylate kinase family enzyme